MYRIDSAQRLLRFQREKAVQQKIDKLQNIRRKKNASLIQYIDSNRSRSLSGYQYQLFRKQKIENSRLRRKLSEIGRRKSDYFRTDEEQVRLLTLNLRARENRRQQKQVTLQQQNDNLVQRIVNKLSQQGSIPQIQNSRVRRNKHKSVILPKLLK